jgi:glycosyltransferase involved in cell wall biosynthesis
MSRRPGDESHAPDLTARLGRAAPRRVAWIADFPVEWLPDAPESLRSRARGHPSTWQSVLLGEIENHPGLALHILAIRKNIARDLVFTRGRVTFHVLKAPGGLRAPSLFWLDTLLLRRALAGIRPEVVHAWGTERGAALVASRLRYPWLVTIQGLLTWYAEMVPMDAYHRFATFFEPIALRRARHATTEAVFSARYLRERYPRLTVSQVEHAPHWHFHRVERRPQTTPVRLLVVGTLCHRKGSDLLLLALDRLRAELDFEVVLVSESPRDFLATIAPAPSPELWARVQLKPHLTPAEIAAELATATLMILPTRVDTSPNAVKEAVVAGVPVVASEVGGIPDYVLPGRNGVLFPAGDLEALVRAIREACRQPLYSQGKVEPGSLAQNRAYLSPARMAEQFLAVYEKVAAAPAAPR